MLDKMAMRFLVALTIIQPLVADLPLSSDNAQIYSSRPEEMNEPVSTLSIQFNSSRGFSELFDCWNVSLVNHLIAKRLAFLEDDLVFGFTNTLSDITTQIPIEKLLSTLSEVIPLIENLETVPFEINELEEAKATAYEFLQQFHQDLSEFPETKDFGFVSSLEFFDQSVQCLENIDLANINEVVSMLHPYSDYHISYTAPDAIYAEPAESLVQFHNALYQECQDCTCKPFFTLDSIPLEEVEMNLTGGTVPSDDPFLTLPLAQWEIDTIKKIINTMGEKNLVQLLMKKKELKKLGKKIHPVHPLRFLEVVFTNAHTIHSMREVRKSSFKWDAFIDGFSEKSNDEFNNNNIIPYLRGFCISVNADYDTVLHFVSKRDWKHLVEYLIRVC